MRTLVFDVKGEYGHFKKPYSPMSPVSFPFPPPCAILGMIGAILGYEKNAYHDLLAWKKCRIGIRLLSPIKIFRSAINLLNTKDGTDIYFRPRAHMNTHIQVNFEFLKDPEFRIYVAGLPDASHDGLRSSLQEQRTIYTPTLGLAQCIAELLWIGEWEGEPVTDETWRVVSVLALEQGVKPVYEPGKKYHRFRVPAEMDSNRVVHRYQEVLVTDDGAPISGKGTTENIYRIGNETITFL